VGSRETAQGIVAVSGQDARDRKNITELTKRVSKALRMLRVRGDVKSLMEIKLEYQVGNPDSAFKVSSFLWNLLEINPA